MSSTSKVIVVQRDRRASAAVRLGFEREGLPVEAPDVAEVGDEAVAALLDDDLALVVAGTDGADAARSLLGALVPAAGETPILWVGNGVVREDAWAAGADEVLPNPAFVRDVVTIGKLLAGRARGHRTQVSGELGDFFGVFYLVRALAATGRSGVLTLVRGLRRAEIRFFQGEVTSAHMGGLHGQAGLHQLLLWTEARFEWRHEPVVRRRQIPLEHDEVLAQAERFLADIRQAAGGLSPSSVYEQDVTMIQVQAKRLPTEVHGVLRLFDGNRTFADVLEDSPFRVFETLRVALRAVEVGLLRKVVAQKPKAARRAVLAVEEWLVGNESKDAVIDRALAIPDTAPGPKIGSGPVGGKKKNKGKKKPEAATPAPIAAADVDWSALVPKASGVDMTSITGVVPSSAASGEIDLAGLGSAIAARREGREGLEALTDRDQRKAMFPTVSVDLGPEPEPEPVLEPVTAESPVPVPVSTAHVSGSIEEAVASAVAAPEPAAEPVAAAEPAAEAAAEPAAAAAAEPAAAAAAAPVEPEPTFLVEDLAAAHAAVAAISERDTKREKPLPTPAPAADAHDPAISASISATRQEIVATVAHAANFSEDEQAFFDAGHHIDRDHAKRPAAHAPESFDDLDEGFRPTTFWERLLGKRDPKKPGK